MILLEFNIVWLLFRNNPKSVNFLLQVEIKLKKKDGFRWNKLEGDPVAQEANVKQFNPGLFQNNIINWAKIVIREKFSMGSYLSKEIYQNMIS